MASNLESIERKGGSQRIAERETPAPRIKKRRHRKEKALEILLIPVLQQQQFNEDLETCSWVPWFRSCASIFPIRKASGAALLCAFLSYSATERWKDKSPGDREKRKRRLFRLAGYVSKRENMLRRPIPLRVSQKRYWAGNPYIIKMVCNMLYNKGTFGGITDRIKFDVR